MSMRREEVATVWLATTRGFYSAVLWDDGRICVRARSKGDLERLRQLVPGMTKVAESRRADYRYRAWCSREEWREAVAALASEVDYGNFKGAVAKVDPDRSHLYGSVWATLLRIRERPSKKEMKRRRKEQRKADRRYFEATRNRDIPDDDEGCPDCGFPGRLDLHTGWSVCDNEECRRFGEVYYGGYEVAAPRRWDDDLDLEKSITLGVL